MSKIKVLEAGMKLKKIDLKNVGNISDLSLTFNEHMNVICGTNGIGKTTILKALKALFVFSENDLKLKYGTENGSIKATSFKDSTRELSIKSVFPADDNRNSEFGGVFKENAVKVIVNPDNRSLDYHQLNAIW